MKKILFFLAILLISTQIQAQAPVNPIPIYSPYIFKIKTSPATYTSYVNITFPDSFNIGYGKTDFFYLRNTGSAIILNDLQGLVGIGATNPLTKLQVFSTVTTRPRGITNSQHSATADGANFNLYKSRGTPGTPLVITANDTIGSVMWRGYDGGQYYQSARIDVLGTGTIAPSHIGGTMIFKTTIDAVLGNPTEAMRITNTQFIGIGTTLPSTILSFGGQTQPTIGVERNTTSNTAGTGVIYNAGGATLLAVDKAGGDHIIKSGQSTGAGQSFVTFYTSGGGVAITGNTFDQVLAERVRIGLYRQSAIGSDVATIAIGTTNPKAALHIETVSAAPVTSGSAYFGGARIGNTGSGVIMDMGSVGSGFTGGWLQPRSPTNYATNYTLALNPNGGGVSINSSAIAASYMLSLGGQATSTIGAERNQTAATAGTGMTISSGGAVSGGLNKGSVAFTLQTPFTTGNSSTSFRIQGTSRNNATSTTDNALYDRFIVASTERLITNVYDTLFSVTIGSDSAWTGIVGYGLQINDNDTIETETGLYYIHIYRGAADAGVIAISSSSQTINGVGATIGGALLFTGTILNGNAGVVYVTVRYRSYLTGIIAGGMKLNFNLLNSSGMGSAITLY